MERVLFILIFLILIVTIIVVLLYKKEKVVTIIQKTQDTCMSKEALVQDTSILKEHFYTLNVVGLDTIIRADVSTSLGCNSYSMSMQWKYKEDKEHLGYYSLHNISGKASEVTRGTAIVTKNNRDTVYDYISGYNSDEKRLLISLLDTNREELRLSGSLLIKLILCPSYGREFSSSGKQFEFDANPTGRFMCR